VGLVTLNRPRALNALSLDMIRALTVTLLAWADDPRVQRVAVRGMGREGPFGTFCAGGDIRFFHQAVLTGDPRLVDFFTEEYALNYLIHTYPKPYVVFMDGVVMGGGMGISAHGSDESLRIATERTKMAMPETAIGLFPDVGGGWFLARCPGAWPWCRRSPRSLRPSRRWPRCCTNLNRRPLQTSKRGNCRRDTGHRFSPRIRRRANGTRRRH